MTASLEPEKIRDDFDMLGMTWADASETWIWYTTAYVNYPPLIYWDCAVRDLFGCDSCAENLVKEGLKPVSPEVTEWFTSPDASDGMSWATGELGNDLPWEGFKLNPTLHVSSDCAFFQGCVYTHGTFTTEGTTAPVSVIGCVLSKDNTAVSPFGHGGNIYLSWSSSIFYCPNYLESKSGQVIIRPILSLYSWNEL